MPYSESIIGELFEKLPLWCSWSDEGLIAARTVQQKRVSSLVAILHAASQPYIRFGVTDLYGHRGIGLGE
jgi:hypothetical protein